MEAKKRIDFMHERFGKNPEHTCENCEHLKRLKFGNRVYKKCEVYGITHGNGTDWKLGNVACGKYNLAYVGPELYTIANWQGNVISSIKRRKKEQNVDINQECLF